MDLQIQSVEDVRKAGQYLLSLGVDACFISLDADGVNYCTSEEEGIVKPDRVEVINVTGAGDSFIAWCWLCLFKPVIYYRDS